MGKGRKVEKRRRKDGGGGSCDVAEEISHFGFY
jgi:hypothetical protein